jgi:translation initiation factor 2-alpha kinase 4
VSRAELVGWLQHQIAEQKRIDLSTYGTGAAWESTPTASSSKDAMATPDVQLVLPADVKKQRRSVKHMLNDRGGFAV